MENNLVNRLPVAAGEVRAKRDQSGSIVDFVWTDINAFGLAILQGQKSDIIGKSITQLGDVFKMTFFSTCSNRPLKPSIT